jgi:hypothetical protein
MWEASSTCRAIVEEVRIRTYHEIILDLATLRFGESQPAQREVVIKELNEQRLLQLVVRILNVSSWAELLAVNESA